MSAPNNNNNNNDDSRLRRISFESMLLSERRERVAATSWLVPERLQTCDTIVQYLCGKDDDNIHVMVMRLSFMLRSNVELACAFAAFILEHHDAEDFKNCMRKLQSRLLWFVEVNHLHDNSDADCVSIDCDFNACVWMLAHNTAAAVLSDCFFRNLHNDIGLSLVNALSHFCKTLHKCTLHISTNRTPREALMSTITNCSFGYPRTWFEKNVPPPALRFLLVVLKKEIRDKLNINVGELIPNSNATRTPSPRPGPIPVDATPPLDDKRVVRVVAKRRRLEMVYPDNNDKPEKPESNPASPPLDDKRIVHVVAKKRRLEMVYPDNNDKPEKPESIPASPCHPGII